MRTGVRLTQLDHGEPLLGSSLTYKNLTSVPAAEERLKDLFYLAKQAGFKFVIDTLRPKLDIDNNLMLFDNDTYKHGWSVERRLELYNNYANETGIDVFLEIEFPTQVTDDNWQKYADYFFDQLICQYTWVKHWQVMVAPEEKISISNDPSNPILVEKCNPVNYVRFLKYVYPKVKEKYDDIKIGGPGIFQALIDFTNRMPNEYDDWLSAAIGDKYKSGSLEFNDVGIRGFLPFIDFFSIQAKDQYNQLNYDIFPEIINNLNQNIKRKINKTLPLYSIVQGYNTPDNSTLEKQGYDELREFFNCMKAGVIPFKYQLVDEFYDSNLNNIDPSKLNYGLLYYYLGKNGYKPAYSDYQYLLNNLNDFDTLTQENIVFEPNPNIESVTLINNTSDKSATIIWSRSLLPQTITLKAHYARQYILKTEEKGSLMDPVILNLDKYEFIIIFQTIEKNIVDIARLENYVERKLNYSEQTLNQLISLLPDTYNKEIKSLNFYKLLRSLAIELADSKIEVETLKNNLYLDNAEDSAIYNNFGILVNLKKKPDWDYEKYRRLVKGVMKSLLEGPTKESIAEAIKLFTNFNVEIYELYNNANINSSPTPVDGINTQFAFVIEIARPLDVVVDQESTYNDTAYVINIVKPAHTLSITIVTLEGEEDYHEYFRNKYGKELQFSDELTNYVDMINTESTFGWKSSGYIGQFETGSIDQIDDYLYLSNNVLTNGSLFIGPRYTLFDSDDSNLNMTPLDTYKDVTESFFDYTLNRFISEKIRPITTKFSIDEVTRSEKYKGIKDFVNSSISRPYVEAKFKRVNDALETLRESHELYNDYQEFMLQEYAIISQDTFHKVLENIIRSPEFKPTDKYIMPAEIQQILEIIPQGMMETYHDIIESPRELYVESLNYEHLRTLELGGEVTHEHKQVVIQITEIPSSLEFFIPERDLFTLSTESEESTTEVYVNGVLQPYWIYTEIQSSLAPTKGIGIKFEPDVVFVGDIINIMYVKDQEILIGDFPFIENLNSSVTLPLNADTLIIKNKVIDKKSETGYERKDTFKKANDYRGTTYMVTGDLSEIYAGKPSDSPNFEGPPWADLVSWNYSSLDLIRFQLNITPLNQGMLRTSPGQEVQNDIGFTTFETMLKPNENGDFEMYRLVQIYDPGTGGFISQKEPIRTETIL